MKRFLLVLVGLIGSWLVWTTSLEAQSDPVAVGLISFTATVQSDGVRLDWETATEVNTGGFIIQRSSDGSNFATLDDIGIVFSEGGVATGATYSEVDKTAVSGQTYTYKLVEIETNSNQIDLETVTITFSPPTPIIIGDTNPTSTPGSNPIAATLTPTAASGTAVSTPSTTQPTATPRPTTAPTATPDSSGSLTGSQPTPAVQNSPTAVPQIDQAFGSSPGASGANSNGANTNGTDSGVVFAQEEPSPAAYPGPDTTTSGTPIDADSYPAGQEAPAEITPGEPTPYPASAPANAAPTLAVIGSDNPYPPETNAALPPSAEAIRGRILLWASFLLALFIFLSGVAGAIVLYRRRPA